MTNLEQTIENSFLGKVKNYAGRIRNSAVSKIAVYSLAGVLSAGIGYGCEQPKDSGSNQPNDSGSNPWGNNGNNDNNNGSNSGNGGYCDSCDGDSDCKEGWRCYKQDVPSVNYQATSCIPSIECISDSQCEGYHCYIKEKLCALVPFATFECYNNDIWNKDSCGNWAWLMEECTENTQCQNIEECGGNIQCSDPSGIAGVWGGKYSCMEVVYKGNGKLGDKCNSDIDCEGALVCYTGSQWPEGYCMLAKAVKGNNEAEDKMKTECKDTYNGTYCDSIYATAWCVKTCIGDADCRSGYYCGLYYVSYDCNENACLPVNQ